jgi:ribosomal protein S20
MLVSSGNFTALSQLDMKGQQMRLYPQTYPVERVRQPAREAIRGITSLWAGIRSRLLIVQSNIRENTAPEPSIDISAVEQRARAERSAYIGSKLKSYYQTLVRKFERAGEAGKEDYLAASQSLAELEDRIRRFERPDQTQP